MCAEVTASGTSRVVQVGIWAQGWEVPGSVVGDLVKMGVWGDEGIRVGGGWHTDDFKVLVALGFDPGVVDEGIEVEDGGVGELDA